MVLAKPKTLGQSNNGPKVQPNIDLVTVVTLVRGRTYFYKDMRFDVDVPIVVTDEIADILEQEVAEINDKEGERFEKPFFEVQRKVPRPPKYVDPNVPKRRPVRRLPPASRRL